LKLKEIPIDQLEISDLNVRQQPYPFGDLEDSIEKHGILNPLLVVESDNSGKYGVVCGSMRFHAARAVGLKTVPCVIRNLSDEEAIVLSLTENIQRGDLTLEEEADGIAKLYEIHKSQKATAEAINKSENWVNERLQAKELVEVLKRHSDSPLAVELPRNPTKVKQIAGLSKFLFSDNEEKQVELFESLKDKNRRDVQRVVTQFREIAEENPERFAEDSVDDMVDDIFKVSHIDVQITFSAKLSKGIEKVVEEREVAYEDVVEIALEQWLKQEGYLE